MNPTIIIALGLLAAAGLGFAGATDTLKEKQLGPGEPPEPGPDDQIPPEPLTVIKDSGKTIKIVGYSIAGPLTEADIVRIKTFLPGLGKVESLAWSDDKKMVTAVVTLDKKTVIEIGKVYPLDDGRGFFIGSVIDQKKPVDPSLPDEAGTVR